MHDGEGIDAQQCRGALRRAILLTANGSLKSIGTGELPSVVAGQATLLLARGGAQCAVESTMCGGICWACAKRVPSRETNGGAFLQLLQVLASPICFQCI